MGRKAKPVITIDCETDPFKRGRVPVPFLWGMYDGERYRRFDDAASLLRYLMDIDCVVYAHNGGKFDYQFILDFIEPWIEITIINGRLAKFTIGKAEFRDSWNILPVPLKTFGKDEIDFAKLEPDVRHKHMAEIERYNARDCRELWDAVTAFRGTYGTGLTLAGSALNFWSKQFKEEKPKTDAAFYHRIAPYYYGGRVQCFHKGPINKGFEVVDINSAYPFAMTHNHPISTTEFECVPSASEAIIPQSLYTIAGVSRGALPWRDERMAMSFPTDNTPREYHVTGWELQAALDTKRLGPWGIVKRLDFLKEVNFTPYVNYFYQMKARADKSSKEYTFAKLFMNSLYGKFGANPENYRIYGIVPREDREGAEGDPTLSLGKSMGPWRWAGWLGKHALMEGADPVPRICPKTGRKIPGEATMVQSQFYNVATAASITGFVRAFLLRHLDKVAKMGGKALYCDTDSIVYHGVKDAAKVFTMGKALGEWSHEGRFTKGAIAGKKLYAFQSHPDDYAAACAKAKAKGDKPPKEWKTATKGVRIGAEAICRVANGEEVTWLAEAPVFTPLDKKQEVKWMKRTVRMT